MWFRHDGFLYLWTFFSASSLLQLSWGEAAIRRRFCSSVKKAVPDVFDIPEDAIRTFLFSKFFFVFINLNNPLIVVGTIEFVFLWLSKLLLALSMIFMFSKYFLF